MNVKGIRKQRNASINLRIHVLEHHKAYFLRNQFLGTLKKDLEEVGAPIN